MKIIIAMLFALILIGCTSQPLKTTDQVIYGNVYKVVDGDTVYVQDADGTRFKIRLYGVNAPELRQSGGIEAKQALTKKIAGKPVRVDRFGHGVFGRIIGKIYLDNEYINLWLISKGYATHYRKYSNDPLLANAGKITLRTN